MMNERASRPSSQPAGARDLARRITTVFGALARALAGRRWFRLWGVLHYVGRKSGRAYATPLVTRRVEDGFIMPLPFGEGTQWVRNLLAAGRATIRWDGLDFAVDEPRIVELWETGEAFSGGQRAILARGNARFVRVRDAV